MYDINWIREHRQAFDRGIERRGFTPCSGALLALDDRRRKAISRLEAALARRNALSREIGQAKTRRDEETAGRLRDEVGALKGEIEIQEHEQREAIAALDAALAEMPNLPLDDVPDGADESANLERHRFGAKPEYSFQPKQHFELGEALRLMDFETAAKLSGARFVVLKRALARLERALAQFMLDVHTAEHGYVEISPPLLVREEVMFGTAQLPKFRDDQFLVTTDAALQELLTSMQGAAGNSPALRTRQLTGEHARWLIPTAEVTLTNLMRKEIIAEEELPLRFTACTPCFRAEAGAAGKDTRGMIRQHQFTKVELVSITTPGQSRDEHERMLACAEEVLRRLDLHYRVVVLSTGDMGFASQKTYDIEVWLPGQGVYREISSCSLCGEFQARRMNARFRGKDGRLRHVHTLNGSGVAVGRALVAVMETYQEADGSIVVPKVLLPYMGGLTRIERSATCGSS